MSLELFQWGSAKEKRIANHIKKRPAGSRFTSSDVAKELNYCTRNTGKIIGILMHEKKINLRMYGQSSGGCYQYEVV